MTSASKFLRNCVDGVNVSVYSVCMEMTVGERISAARKRADITQEALAGMVEVSTRTMAKIERGETSPRVSLVRKIAAELGLEAGELLA